jgi:hypothetical protein
MPRTESKRKSPQDAPSRNKKSLVHKLHHTGLPYAGEGADWERVDSAVLLSLVKLVCDSGAAILLGYSRDGFCYNITILDDGEKHTEWIQSSADPTEQIDGFINQLTQVMLGDGDDAA